MKLKQFIRRIFSELYHWQNDLYGKDNLPALTALLALSSLEFFNVGSILMIIQTTTSIDIFGYFNRHLIIGMIIPALLFLTNYLVVKPIEVTIKDYPPQKKKIIWIYILITLLILAVCIVWIVILNNKKGI